MLYCAVALFAFGLVAARFGFAEASMVSVGAAQVFFVLFALSVVAHYLLGFRRGAVPPSDG